MKLSPGEIAHVCHEANRALQIALGDPAVSPRWEHAPNNQRRSARHGVVEAQQGRTPAELHDEWCRYHRAEGWVYGPTKSALEKTHPCLVPYEELPAGQKAKDLMFLGIVAALSTPGEVSLGVNPVVATLPAADEPTEPMTVLPTTSFDSLVAALSVAESHIVALTNHVDMLQTRLAAAESDRV